MQALQTIKKIQCPSSYPGFIRDDIGQFEVDEEQHKRKLATVSDLNYSYFDMKETAYSEVELTWLAFHFCGRKNSDFGSFCRCDDRKKKIPDG